MNLIKIYLTNLSKYNESELVGQWVTLPVDDFKPILEKIGNPEEYFITDYEAPFEIGEYANIYELNEIAKELEDLDAIQKEVFVTLLNESYNYKEALEIAQNRDFTYIPGNTDDEFISEYIDMLGGNLIDAVGEERLKDYFDYAQFGRGLISDNVFEKTENGYIDEEGWEIKAKDEYELAEKFIDEVFGGIDELKQETLERYFDYDKFKNAILQDFIETENGYVQL